LLAGEKEGWVENVREGLGIGERLLAARQSRGMTLRELAARADISASQLSQIENGKAMPSVMSLQNIATALSMPIRYFFPEEEPAEGASERNGDVAYGGLPGGPSDPIASARAALSGDVRADARADGPAVRPEDRAVIELLEGVRWARLTPGPERGIEFVEATYPVGVSSGPALMRHEGREFVFVLEGELLIEVGFERYELREEDSIVFDSSTPHRVTNLGEGPARAVWVMFDRR
jgi:transcriptional regulator with XRE-family HTH domain